MGVATAERTDPSEVADRVYRLRMPLPWAIDVMPLAGATVNVFVIRRGDQLVLVDGGFASAQCWDVLTDGLTRLGHGVGDITDVVVTHCHPDHVGVLDQVLQEARAARVWIRPADRELTRERHRRPDEHMSDLVADMREEGLPPHEPADPSSLALDGGEFVDGPQIATAPGAEDVWDLDIDGERWQLTPTSGHTPGHQVLSGPDGLLITGDLLLAGTHTHVGVHPGCPADPMGDQRRSLRWLRDNAPDVIHPGHGSAIQDPRKRVESVLRQQDRRMKRIIGVLEEQPLTAYEVVTQLFLAGGDAIGDTGRQLAMTETVAYLRHLQGAGLVRAVPGEDARRWQASDPATTPANEG